MSVRAVVLGFLGAIFLAAAGHINDEVLRLTYLVGNHFPISVFGLLVLMAALVCPLLFVIRPSWRLRPAELAVAAALMMVAGFLPGSGFFRNFDAAVTMPAHYNQTLPGWRKNNVLSYAPPVALVAGGRYDEEAVGGWMSGMGQEGNPIGLSEVPWGAWRGPLLAWTPLVLLCGVATICLSLVVHRQWSSHERLRYPIVDFTAAVIQQEPGRAFGPIFRNKLFWIGLVAVLALRVLDGLAVWYPGFTSVPLQYDFTAIAKKWEIVQKAPYWEGLVKPKIYPMVIGFAFFLAMDVSLSLGLTQIFHVPLMALMVTLGFSASRDYMNGGIRGWQCLGSSLSLAALLLYIGRRYYWSVFRRALLLGKADEVEPYAAWACRFFLLSMAGMAAILTAMGLAWTLSILAVLLTMLLFLVIARLNAECGLFAFKPAWVAPGALVGLMGFHALGPQNMVIIGMMTLVLAIDARECMMPYIVNGLKMCEDAAVRPSRVGWASAGVLVVALAMTLVVGIWADYNYGAPLQDKWVTSMGKTAFDSVAGAVTELRVSDRLQSSVGLGPLQRLAEMKPDKEFLWSGGVGFAASTVVSLLRLRYSWWPLHPILFLVWGTGFIAAFSHSFLIGWVVKLAVTRFGGSKLYQSVKVLMIGVIAGDLLGGLVFMAAGAAYYSIYNAIPPRYQIFPT